MRLPAREIETLVIERLEGAVSDSIGLLEPSSSSTDEHDIPALVEKPQELAALLRNGRDGLVQTLVGDIVDRNDITLSDSRIKLDPYAIHTTPNITIRTTLIRMHITTTVHHKTTRL